MKALVNWRKRYTSRAALAEEWRWRAFKWRRRAVSTAVRVLMKPGERRELVLWLTEYEIPCEYMHTVYERYQWEADAN